MPRMRGINTLRVWDADAIMPHGWSKQASTSSCRIFSAKAYRPKRLCPYLGIIDCAVFLLIEFANDGTEGDQKPRHSLPAIIERQNGSDMRSGLTSDSHVIPPYHV